jgi:hypothetical protein
MSPQEALQTYFPQVKEVAAPGDLLAFGSFEGLTVQVASSGNDAPSKWTATVTHGASRLWAGGSTPEEALSRLPGVGSRLVSLLESARREQVQVTAV